MAEEDVVMGIENALEASPENHSMRLHLAELQLQAERGEEALANARIVIAAH